MPRRERASRPKLVAGTDLQTQNLSPADALADKPVERFVVCLLGDGHEALGREFGYRHRNGLGDKHRKYINTLLNDLSDLYSETDPTKGEATERGKDHCAFDALQVAGKLVEAVAGWAVDHVAGKAIAGYGFLPMQPSGTKNHPDYIVARAQNDTHELERLGSKRTENIEAFEADPLVARTIMLHMIQANSGAFPSAVKRLSTEALKALDFGEVLPLLAPNQEKTHKQVKYIELNYQLRAFQHVRFRMERGFKQKEALEEVGNAYCVAPSTVRSWGFRLRTELGSLEVERAQSFAENRASHVRAPVHRRDPDLVELAEQLFGEEALHRDGQRYRAWQKARESEVQT